MTKKCAVLFSGGKDSIFAAWIAKQEGYELACLISVFSLNKESYMFHTPSISQVKKQAEVMKLPLLTKKTKGVKEEELKDLKKAINLAKKKYNINTIITGALKSDYQASRIQRICNELGLECFNPLWHKPEIEYLHKLIKANFKVIIIGVFAYPFDKNWLGREIDESFVKDIKELNRKYKIHPAGEGGEFETFVLNAPGLFKHELKIKNYKDIEEGENAWRREIEVS